MVAFIGAPAALNTQRPHQGRAPAPMLSRILLVSCSSRAPGVSQRVGTDEAKSEPTVVGPLRDLHRSSRSLNYLKNNSQRHG